MENAAHRLKKQGRKMPGNRKEVPDDFNQFEQSDANILGNMLPSNVWDLVSSRLPVSGMKDMSNSSPYFRNILLPKRTQFLLPDVLKPLCEQFEKEHLNEQHVIEEAEEIGQQYKIISNVLECRQLCKSWNKSIKQFIEVTSTPNFFNADNPSSNNGPLARAKYTYFGEHSWGVAEFLAHFKSTHPPLSHPQRNPFIGHLLFIKLIDIPFQNENFHDQMRNPVITLLGHYGQHVRILNIGLAMGNPVLNHLWLTKCLALVPHLTHLKVSSLSIQTDIQFGEHLHQHQPSLRRGLPVQVNRNERQLNARELENMVYYFDEIVFQNPAVVRHLSRIELRPLPSLQCLKLCSIPAAIFNSLIQAYSHVEWLHVERANYRLGRNYLDWRQLELPNLNTIYIQLHSPAEARQLRDLDLSRWGKLTSVHLEYSWKAKFYKWSELFKIIEEIWGDSLIELKLRLPKPKTFMEKLGVMKDAVNCSLTLPKLKRLKLWMWTKDGFCVPLNFLDPVMDNNPELEFKQCDDNENY